MVYLLWNKFKFGKKTYITDGISDSELNMSSLGSTTIWRFFLPVVLQIEIEPWKIKIYNYITKVVKQTMGWLWAKLFNHNELNIFKVFLHNAATLTGAYKFARYFKS